MITIAELTPQSDAEWGPAVLDAYQALRNVGAEGITPLEPWRGSTWQSCGTLASGEVVRVVVIDAY